MSFIETVTRPPTKYKRAKLRKYLASATAIRLVLPINRSQNCVVCYQHKKDKRAEQFIRVWHNGTHDNKEYFICSHCLGRLRIVRSR